MPGKPVISGEVVSDDGIVVGAAVMFAEAPQPTPDVAALTDEQGRFVLSSVGPGHYRITVNAAGFPLVQTEFDLSSENVSLTVRVG